MKKLFDLKKLSLAVLLGMSMITTSCAGGGTSTKAPATTTPTPAVAAATPAAATPAPTAKALVKLTVGATSVPHAEILKSVVDDLKTQGIDLVVKEFSDYKLINPATVDCSLDANYFQHIPYLTDYNTNAKTNLVSVGPIHIEPLGLYSKKIKALTELKSGDKIGIPNDATNETRALKLLESNGIIKLDPAKTSNLTKIDIKENPKNLKFTELDAAQLPRTIDEFTASVINTNYALEGGFNPSKDALIKEDGANNPYANCLVVRKGDETKPEIIALYKALTTEKTRAFIMDKYKGAIVPAF